MIPPRLHAVTDDRVLARPDFLERARAMALGPEVAVHLRTRADGRRALAMVERVVTLARPTGTLVIVNGRVDIALASGADGVHLPEAGLPPAVARRLAPGLRVGRSLHAPDPAATAAVDWTFLGPLWATPSHPDRPVLGVTALVGAGERIVAIGGMTVSRAREARRHGAIGVAAVSALWDAPDPEAAARAFLLSFDG